MITYSIPSREFSEEQRLKRTEIILNVLMLANLLLA